MLSAATLTLTITMNSVQILKDPPPPMRSVLLSPVYRGRITKADPAPIALRAHLRFEPDNLIVASVLAVLRARGAAGAATGAAGDGGGRGGANAAALPPPIAQQLMGPFKFNPRGAAAIQVDINFPQLDPLKDLVAGEYVVSVTCLDQSNHTLGSVIVELLLTSAPFSASAYGVSDCALPYTTRGGHYVKGIDVY
jgi:hypothetical protein